MPSGINNNRRPATPPVTGPQAETSTAGPQTTPLSAVEAAEASPTPGEMTPQMEEALGTPSEIVSSEKVMETFFAPNDDMRKVELQLLDEVIAARKTDSKTYVDGKNPFQIRYAVYNISSREVLEKLVEASKAGVDVQILIEDHQLDPKKYWNQADEYLQDNGFSFEGDHTKLRGEENLTTDLIGIKNNNLMHLKSRIISYPEPETGKPIKKLLTGSMNPGESAVRNDENLNLISDPDVVDRYVEMYEAVRDGKTISNKFDDNKAINPMFTGAPVKGGPRVTNQIFKWIDQEQEAIFLSVFSLRNLTTPGARGNLVKKLKAAKDRGVEVVVVTDRKQSDGVDVEGNQVFWDDRTDDMLREAGIPVYEAINDSGPHNAMHAKSAVFGLTEMKVITDTGNWTKAALGSKRRAKKDQNEESFLFVDSNKLDDNQTGRRYLGNFMHLLRKYSAQNPNEPDAETLINRLSENPAWPKVTVDFSVMAHTFMGQEVYVTGDHPALGNWTTEGPGLKLNTAPGRYPTWESGGSLDLPFGTQFSYKVVKKNPDGSLEWEPGQNSFLIVDPTDSRFTIPDDDMSHMVRDDQF